MPPSRPILQAEAHGDALALKVGGTWRLTKELPLVSEVMRAHAGSRQVRVVADSLEAWDSSLPLFLLQLRAWCRERQAALDLESLPEKLKTLFRLIRENEEKAPAPRAVEADAHPFLALAHRAVAELEELAGFLGACVIGALQTPADPRKVRWKDFFSELVETGPKALPIIALLSFLIGVVFAFETTTQLRRFGAQIYVINALSVAVVRQIGPILAAVILAGRTGAAFAAHLGKMKVGGELDALEVLGVSPVNFLVLPRLAALFCMMPLLALYADFFGIAGGLITTMLKIDIPAAEFWVKLQAAVTLSDVLIGLLKSVVFGVLVGLAGTLRGLQCERTSAGVGRAATSAVVTAITAIIAGNTLLSPIIDKLGR